MSIETKINTYLKTKEGKQKIAESKSKVFKEGGTFGQQGVSISKEDAVEAAEKQKEFLLRRLAEVGLGTIPSEAIIIGEPTIDKNGDIFVGIWLDPDSLFRPSLSPRYEGIENIVLHFTHGWSAHGAVHGYWKSVGKDVWSRSKYAGDDFMQQAVDDFNELGLGTAELNEKYL